MMKNKKIVIMFLLFVCKINSSEQEIKTELERLEHLSAEELNKEAIDAIVGIISSEFDQEDKKNFIRLIEFVKDIIKSNVVIEQNSYSMFSPDEIVTKRKIIIENEKQKIDQFKKQGQTFFEKIILKYNDNKEKNIILDQILITLERLESENDTKSLNLLLESLKK
jgi:hypothetical protein